MLHYDDLNQVSGYKTQCFLFVCLLYRPCKKCIYFISRNYMTRFWLVMSLLPFTVDVPALSLAVNGATWPLLFWTLLVPLKSGSPCHGSIPMITSGPQRKADTELFKYAGTPFTHESNSALVKEVFWAFWWNVGESWGSRAHTVQRLPHSYLPPHDVKEVLIPQSYSPGHYWIQVLVS